MNSKKTGPQPESKPDDLIRSNTVELTEEDLDSVSGGTVKHGKGTGPNEQLVESLKLLR
jgi:hypothetical protein